MGVYTPKAGSIGHVAVTDEDFERCQWIFGKHEISGAFGINALDYWTQYQLQVAQFKEIRDQTIFDLIEDPLNEDQTRLRKGLREKLRNWMGILQLCEDIIIYCENINGMDTGNSEEGQAHSAWS